MLEPTQVNSFDTMPKEQLLGPIINVDLAFEKMGFKCEAEPGWKEVGKEGKRRKVMSGDNEAEKGHTKGSRQRRCIKSQELTRNLRSKARAPKFLIFRRRV